MSWERRAPLDGRTVVTLEGRAEVPELWPEGGAEEVELWSGFRMEDRREKILKPLLSASHVVKVKG